MVQVLPIISIIVLVIIVVLHIVSLATPWYNQTGWSNGNCQLNTLISWYNISAPCDLTLCVPGTIDYPACEETAIYYANPAWRVASCESIIPSYDAANSPACKTFPMIFDGALAMICIGLICTVAIFILVVLGLVRDQSSSLLKIIRIGCAILGFSVTVVAVVEFALALPQAYIEQYQYEFNNPCPIGTNQGCGCTFIGQYSPVTGGLYFWGPATGWIIAVVNCFFTLVISILSCVPACGGQELV